MSLRLLSEDASSSITCNVVRFGNAARYIAERMSVLYRSALMVVGARHGGIKVGEVESQHTQEVR